jgi:hypothetical protein
MGLAHIIISRRRGKHRAPRAPMQWLAGFAQRAAQKTIVTVKRAGALTSRN